MFNSLRRKENNAVTSQGGDLDYSESGLVADSGVGGVGRTHTYTKIHTYTQERTNTTPLLCSLQSWICPGLKNILIVL